MIGANLRHNPEIEIERAEMGKWKKSESSSVVYSRREEDETVTDLLV